MTAIEKLIASIKINTKSVRFNDACKVAQQIDFIHKGGKGSHRTFGLLNEPKLLNFQNRKGFIPPYQARQLIEMINKYEQY